MDEHTRFEELIFSGTSAEAGPQRDLERHLQACPRCRRLADAWPAVRIELGSAEMAAPAPGFAARWLSQLQRDQQQRSARQVRLSLVLMTGAAGVLLLVLLFAILNAPAAYPTAGLKALIQAERLISVGSELLLALLESLPGPSGWLLATAGTLGLALTFAGLGAAWVILYIRSQALVWQNGG